MHPLIPMDLLLLWRVFAICVMCMQACAPRYVYHSRSALRRDPIGACYVSRSGSDSAPMYSQYSPCRRGRFHADILSKYHNEIIKTRFNVYFILIYKKRWLGLLYAVLLAFEQNNGWRNTYLYSTQLVYECLRILVVNTVYIIILLIIYILVSVNIRKCMATIMNINYWLFYSTFTNVFV